MGDLVKMGDKNQVGEYHDINKVNNKIFNFVSDYFRGAYNSMARNTKHLFKILLLNDEWCI